MNAYCSQSCAALCTVQPADVVCRFHFGTYCMRIAVCHVKHCATCRGTVLSGDVVCRFHFGTYWMCIAVSHVKHCTTCLAWHTTCSYKFIARVSQLCEALYNLLGLAYNVQLRAGVLTWADVELLVLAPFDSLSLWAAQNR